MTKSKKHFVSSNEQTFRLYTCTYNNVTVIPVMVYLSEHPNVYSSAQQMASYALVSFTLKHMPCALLSKHHYSVAEKVIFILFWGKFCSQHDNIHSMTMLMFMFTVLFQCVSMLTFAHWHKAQEAGAFWECHNKFQFACMKESQVILLGTENMCSTSRVNPSHVKLPQCGLNEWLILLFLKPCAFGKNSHLNMQLNHVIFLLYL